MLMFVDTSGGRGWQNADVSKKRIKQKKNEHNFRESQRNQNSIPLVKALPILSLFTNPQIKIGGWVVKKSDVLGGY